MRTTPAWILILSFLVGAIAVVYFAFPAIPESVKPPAEICLAKNFPGKSVATGEINAETRSVFQKTKTERGLSIVSDKSDKFYAALEEQRFTPEIFRDAELFPEIAAADEIYRFFWLRTFHSPVMIRVYRTGGEKYLVLKQTDGQGGYDFGKLTINETRKIEDSEWCEFIRLLDEADFWNKKKVDLATIAHDGAFWNIEGVREQRYYISGEQSPEAGKFREACIYLMRISGLKIDENSEDFY